MTTPFEYVSAPEELAYGVPADWDARPRLTLWTMFLFGALLLGALATIVATIGQGP